MSKYKVLEELVSGNETRLVGDIIELTDDEALELMELGKVEETLEEEIIPTPEVPEPTPTPEPTPEVPEGQVTSSEAKPWVGNHDVMSAERESESI